MNYKEFLLKKIIEDKPSGFNTEFELNPKLFNWQKVLVNWGLIRGRAAYFEDCGLGKTVQQLEWGRHIYKKIKSPVLILAPLAVANQTKQEGRKFNIPVNICYSKDDVKSGINITNYEKLHKFNPSILSAIILDESSILKNYTGAYRNEIIDFSKSISYRLACTATPAPNDYEELGNHAEFLGIMTRSEMLSMFFINDTKDTGTWRLKGHVSNNIFWTWIASWAVMISKPSDIGFSDEGFILPSIHYYEHIIKPEGDPKKGLFFEEARTMQDRRNIRTQTIELRANEAAKIINKNKDKWVVWCNLNPEGDYLEKVINNSVQVAGKHSDEIKIKRITGFANGEIQRLITKPKIAGLGINWQICHNAAYIGLSDSWEQLYQSIRRLWRFGQKEEVNIHIFIEEREGSVLKNIYRKDKQARTMMQSMIKHMKELTKKELKKADREEDEYNPIEKMRLPKWI